MVLREVDCPVLLRDAEESDQASAISILQLCQLQGTRYLIKRTRIGAVSCDGLRVFPLLQLGDREADLAADALRDGELEVGIERTEPASAEDIKQLFGDSAARPPDPWLLVAGCPAQAEDASGWMAGIGP